MSYLFLNHILWKVVTQIINQLVRNSYKAKIKTQILFILVNLIKMRVIKLN